MIFNKMGLFNLFRTLVQNQVLCGSLHYRYDLEPTIFYPTPKNITLKKPLVARSSHLLYQEEFEIYSNHIQQEKYAAAQYQLAASIQSSWKGCIIRYSLKLVSNALQIVKIQAFLAYYIAKGNRETFVEEIANKRKANYLLRCQTEAAKKIQAAWRGYSSRKTGFNFAEFKKIRTKNETLKRSIERINELETALVKSLESKKKFQERLQRTLTTSSSSLSRSSKKKYYAEKEVKTEGDSGSDTGQMGNSDRSTYTSSPVGSFTLQLDSMTPSQENIAIDNLPEVVSEMSESRIAELYAYLANMETEMNREKKLLESQVKKLGGIHNLNPEQLYRLEETHRKQRERANRILDLAKLEMMRKLEGSVVVGSPCKKPGSPDAVKTDRTKVRALKDAIRLFRQKGHVKEEWELKSNHFLLRTRQCPGVYSDIFTTELTEMEKRLKAVKFWKGSMAAERIRKKEETTRNQRLRRLFTHAMRISERKTSNNGTADDEEESDEEAVVTTAEDYNDYCREISPEQDNDDDDEEEERADETMEKKDCHFYLPPLEPFPINNLVRVEHWPCTVFTLQVERRMCTRNLGNPVLEYQYSLDAG